jgi:hypothetical protein
MVLIIVFIEHLFFQSNMFGSAIVFYGMKRIGVKHSRDVKKREDSDSKKSQNPRCIESVNKKQLIAVCMNGQFKPAMMIFEMSRTLAYLIEPGHH